jgi:hypothetical protein
VFWPLAQNEKTEISLENSPVFLYNVSLTLKKVFFEAAEVFLLWARFFLGVGSLA